MFFDENPDDYDYGKYMEGEAQYAMEEAAKWVKTSERLPELGKLVYTRNDKGYVAAFALYEHGWNTKLSDVNSHDNSPIVEWYNE